MDCDESLQCCECVRVCYKDQAKANSQAPPYCQDHDDDDGDGDEDQEQDLEQAQGQEQARAQEQAQDRAWVKGRDRRSYMPANCAGPRLRPHQALAQWSHPSPTTISADQAQKLCII